MELVKKSYDIKQLPKETLIMLAACSYICKIGIGLYFLNKAFRHSSLSAQIKFENLIKEVEEINKEEEED